MNLPDAITERFPFLDPLEEDWKPVARWALAVWLLFYPVFLYQAYRHQGPMLMIDAVFVPIHEGGHFCSVFSAANGSISRRARACSFSCHLRLLFILLFRGT